MVGPASLEATVDVCFVGCMRPYCSRRGENHGRREGCFDSGYAALSVDWLSGSSRGSGGPG